MTKPRILIQLDPDVQASVFDAVVAVDCQVDHVLQYAGVRSEQVQGLVHGAMFTRGPSDLRKTAIFVGGTDVRAGEALLDEVKRTFFGPLRVSVMLDANGANTTAAAAVVTASRHLAVAGTLALVLAGTGPVGQRVARLLAQAGARVRLASRKRERAEQVASEISARVGNGALIEPCATQQAQDLAAALKNVELVVAAGAAGVELLSRAARAECSSLRVAIDLNAVPPVGIEGIDVMDAARQDGQVTCYGAIGVGGTKMKIHKASVGRLFEDNGQVLDAEEIFQLGQSLEQPRH